MPEYKNDIGETFCGAHRVIEWSYRENFSILTPDGLHIVGVNGDFGEESYLGPGFDVTKIANCRRCLLDPYRRCDLDQMTSDLEPQPNLVSSV